MSDTPHTEHAHVGRRLLDVSTLPAVVQDHRDPLWWGVWMLIAIETTMFALLATAYVYLRGNFTTWPPPGAANPPIAVTGATLAALLASCVPIWFSFRAARHGDLRIVRLGFIGVTILSLIATVLRAIELTAIGYNWNSHAYGSVVWAIYFMHTVHLILGTGENAVFTALLFRGPVEKKHMLDVRLAAYYWWFIVAGWLALWVLITFDDLLFRNSFVS